MTVLPTFADLPIVSPLAPITDDLPPDAQVQAAREHVGLGELTDRRLLHIRGNDLESVPKSLSLKIGEVEQKFDSLRTRLRRDEYVLLTRDGWGAIRGLKTVIGDQNVTVTDITHGRCGLHLIGADAARVLPKVCALDFSDKAFPNMHAAQTSLAKVRTLIIRADIDETTPSYALIVDRSLATYVWDVVFDATLEFDGIALSSEAVKLIRRFLLW